MSVVIETTVGDLVIDLYYDERPNCCKNFLKLCKMKYYHYCLFHNIQKDFIAQTGDPTGTGRGGESIYGLAYGDQAKYFERELLPKIKHRKLGAVSMINNGDDKHGSQFLITLAENLVYLDDKHTVFGEVAKGFEVLALFNECIADREGRPYQDIRICHTVILDDPFEDIRGLEYPRRSPEPTEELLQSDRIRVDEDVNILEGKTDEEIKEILEERETKKRATVLEIIGDIPDADIKPPDNVLFVCKLNPVTNDDDLELIFSRFGKILSCEVIRDRVTGDSLCYAFIEFENEEDCENAYFKMDNVLIDDRRIHVDFSQSVAKLYWKSRKGSKSGPEKYNLNDIKNEEKYEKYDERSYKIKEKSSYKRTNNYEFVFDKNDDSKFDSKYEKISKHDKKRHYESHRRDEDHYRSSSSNHHKDKYYEKSNKDYDRKKDHRDRSREKERERDRDRYDRRSPSENKSNHRHHKKSSDRR